MRSRRRSLGAEAATLGHRPFIVRPDQDRPHQADHRLRRWEVERATKALHHDDGPAAPICYSPVARAAPQPSEHRPHEQRHRPAAGVIPGWPIAQRRYGEVTTAAQGRRATRSTRCAARLIMRLPPQLRQKPRLLHENATRRSVRHRVQRMRAKRPSEPQRRNARSSSSPNLGSPRRRAGRGFERAERLEGSRTIQSGFVSATRLRSLAEAKLRRAGADW
jgi:hypothetical protein